MFAAKDNAVTRFILRRLAILPLALLVINFISFAYATLAQRVQQAQNPFGAAPEPVPIFTLYLEYLRGLLRGDLGAMPTQWQEPILGVVAQAAIASLGLFLLAFAISASLGVLLGMLATRRDLTGVASWMLPLSAVGLAAPGFLIAAAGIALLLTTYLSSGPEGGFPIPIQGYGWDSHLILPLLALVAAPSARIARTVSGTLADELQKQHVVAARSLGIAMRRIRRKHALRNVLPAVILVMAGSTRLLVSELILVEWIFGWPGLGRLLAFALIPPNVASASGLIGAKDHFLDPELIAAVLTGFGLLFIVVDGMASILVYLVDPRLRAQEHQHEHHQG